MHATDYALTADEADKNETKRRGCLPGVAAAVVLVVAVAIFGAVTSGSRRAADCPQSSLGRSAGTVPSMAGKTYRDAKAELSCLGYPSVATSSATFGDTRPKNDLWIVTYQQPSPHVPNVMFGTVITLDLSPPGDATSTTAHN